MRRGQVGVLLAVTSGLFSVLLAVAVNVATGGELPGSLASVAWLAWPAVGVLGLVGIGLAIWQQHLANATPPFNATPPPPNATPPSLNATPPLNATPFNATPPPAGGTVPRTAGAEPPEGGTVPRRAGAEPPAGGTVPRRAGAEPPAGGTVPSEGRTAPPAVGMASPGDRTVSARAETVTAGAGALRPAELPAAPAVFGRDAVAGEIGAALRGAAVIVVAAAPGTGKTALALRVAHDVRERFPDGQLYATLLGGAGPPLAPEAVLTRFLKALGVPDVEGLGRVDELAARFRSAVADRAVLVVLDDARDAEQVAPLIPGGSRCATLVTSRAQLDGLPGARVVGLGTIADEAALALLHDLAGDRITRDPGGARELVAACGGLPLAVRVVGGRLRARSGWTPGQLAARLRDENKMLDGLRATFRGAYDGLGETEQVVFRRAGSHPGAAFGTRAAAARAGLDLNVTEQALERLADGFLVESPEPDRYKLHDLLRLFASETVDAAGERREVVGRLLQESSEAAVLREGLAAGLRDEVVRAAGAPPQHIDDGHEWLAVRQVVVEALREAGGARLAEALRALSGAYTFVGQVQAALPPIEEAAALAQEEPEIAKCARRLGEALRDLGRTDEAEAALLRALELCGEQGMVEEELEVSAALGVLYNNDRRFERSRPVLERALTLQPDVRDVRRGWVLLSLAVSVRFAGDARASAALVEEAAAVAREAGDRYQLSYCHQEAGWALFDLGDLDGARREFTTMLAICRDLRVGFGEASAVESLGVVADRRGDHAAGRAAALQAAELYERLGDERRAEMARGNAQPR
ncbi:NB-ARC domain-containing protein [Dactylosporangium sp. CS-033363]|uniref:NB-ARC domain-containing protein n=1 Tax=Dactylosporangium sp. CS-033363 TaxID=3239935 RepID=UPI003D90AA0A